MFTVEWKSHFKYDKILVLVMLLFQTIISSAQVKTAKNISYANNSEVGNTLNVFYKNDGVKDKPVLIFIHGGSWSSGKKETYGGWVETSLGKV
ncbi:hypothetical protein ACFOG5_24540 [Pedobacter fastidiosus]|uniref:hypothetical protein n=1 Tax=Pedobacter fastidiosus TaxID=2765361 RepID=UPI00360A10FA